MREIVTVFVLFVDILFPMSVRQLCANNVIDGNTHTVNLVSNPFIYFFNKFHSRNGLLQKRKLRNTNLFFVITDGIYPVFDTLVDLASEHVMPLMEYVRRTWLESDVWPVHSWSVYGRSVRTNNDVEGKYTFIISLLMIKFNTLENYSRSWNNRWI